MLSELRTGHGTPRGGTGTRLEEKSQVLGTSRQLMWGAARRGVLPPPWQARKTQGQEAGQAQSLGFENPDQSSGEQLSRTQVWQQSLGQKQIKGVQARAQEYHAWSPPLTQAA